MTEETTVQVDAETVRRQAKAVGEKTLEAAPEKKSRVFYDQLRETCIPFLPCYLQEDGEELFCRCVDALFLLARANVPLAVGFTMHQYNFAALATLPVPWAPRFEIRRKILVETMESYRSLMAICSLGDNIAHKNQASKNVLLARQEDGSLVANGRKAFTSMASEADLILFSGTILDTDELGLFYADLKTEERVELDKPLFSGAMSLTDTRPINFKELPIKERTILSEDENLTLYFSYYATAWFETLICATYLGGVSRALEEFRKFAFSVHLGEETLAERDGVILEAGKLALEFRACLAMIRSFGVCVGNYTRAVREEAPEEVQQSIVNDLYDCAFTIKYHCTQKAEELLHRARRLIGTRSMAASHPVYELSQQVIFASLHPSIGAHIERTQGSEYLCEEPFFGTFDWAFG